VSDAHRNGLEFTGEDGRSIFVARGILEMAEELRKRPIEAGETRLYESRLHERNFIDCVYNAQAPITPVEVGHRSISVAHVANIAIRLGRTTLAWDPATETVPGDAAANAMLSRPMRKEYAV
jgi:hypothetical protein